MKKVEIVFSGLCSFLNLKDTNGTMPEPSVILVRTDLPLGPPYLPMGEHIHPNTDTADDKHIPFIAFDSTKVLVNNASGFVRASRSRPNFWYRRLDGVLLKIEDLKPGPLAVHPSYDRVLSKDKYWPAAKNAWNRDFVPRRTEKPKKSAVEAFLRFEGGTITASRLSRVQWDFVVPEKPNLIDYFLEEVVYSDFVQTPDPEKLTIEVLDLEIETLITALTFTMRPDRQDQADETITVFIGNNNDAGMNDGLGRESNPNAQPSEGKHIAFLNQVADRNVRVPASVPTPVPAPLPPRPQTEHPAGGGDAGFCGPENANG